jgi:hypothetical protein
LGEAVSVRGVVYLSGPISLNGKASQQAMSEAIGRFAHWAEALRTDGYEVVNPCECDAQESWEAYMKVHLPSVCRASRVAVLPDWQLSRGSTLEVFVATQLGIPVVPVEDFA